MNNLALSNHQIDTLFGHIADGYSLKKAAEAQSLDAGQLRRLLANTPDLLQRYETVRMLGCDALADRIQDMHELIDDTAKATLASNNAKWLLARLNSRKYGDKLDVSVSGTIDLQAAINAGRQRLEQQRIDDGITIDTLLD